MAVEPITLTKFGDTLEVDAEWSRTNDGTEMSLVSYIGWHRASRNFMYLKPASGTHNRLCCQQLALSIPVPKTVKTYGQLRQWLAEQLEADARHEIALMNAVAHFSALHSPDSQPSDLPERSWDIVEEVLG